MPAIAESRRSMQRRPALAPNPDGWVRSLGRCGIDADRAKPEVLPRVRDHAAAPASDHDLERLVRRWPAAGEQVLRPDGGELVALPSDPHAQNRAPTAQDVEGGHDL